MVSSIKKCGYFEQSQGDEGEEEEEEAAAEGENDNADEQEVSGDDNASPTEVSPSLKCKFSELIDDHFF